MSKIPSKDKASLRYAGMLTNSRAVGAETRKPSYTKDALPVSMPGHTTSVTLGMMLVTTGLTVWVRKIHVLVVFTS